MAQLVRRLKAQLCWSIFVRPPADLGPKPNWLAAPTFVHFLHQSRAIDASGIGLYVWNLKSIPVKIQVFLGASFLCKLFGHFVKMESETTLP